MLIALSLSDYIQKTITYFFKILFICLRERAHVHTREREREREREKLSTSWERSRGRERSRLPTEQGAQCRAPSPDPGIMT